MKLRHVTSVGKFKCCSLQLVLVQQRNFRLQITIARYIQNYILLHSYASFDSDAIPIPSLTPYNWVITANLGTPNGAGNVILQQATCVCLIGWEFNHNFYECLQKIFIPCATCLHYFPLQRSCPRKPVHWFINIKWWAIYFFDTSPKSIQEIDACVDRDHRKTRSSLAKSTW